MISRPPTPGRARNAGIALVAVLALLVLITGITIAFFSKVASERQLSELSEKSLLTRELARNAVAMLSDDLVREMKAGAVSTGAAPGGIWRVDDPQRMLPQRQVAASLPAPTFAGGTWSNGEALNLVKQSKSGVPFFSFGSESLDGRASDISTSSRSKNGRRVPPSVWSAPRLMADGYDLPTDAVPDWVFIARDGSTPTAFAPALKDASPANPGFVVGRFAYQIYDVGGLLDANAAGFAPDALPGGTELIGSKGAQLMADLRALPGMGAASAAEALAGWRNKGDWSAAHIENLREFGEQHGWLKPRATADDNDNFFLGRQDLVSFLESRLGESSARQALPFLTTFQRELDQPSFAPDPDRPKILADRAGGGNTEFGRDDKVNPNLAEAAFNGGDAATSPIPRRFPLDRLAEVATATAGTGDAAAILKHFGLEWNAAANGQKPPKAWVYARQNPDGKIMTLEEVAAAGREANFVELLKAAIHAGSLGHQGWPWRRPPGSAPSVHSNQSGQGSEDGSLDRNIIQIAANIIDQADEDHLPTRLFFPGATGRTYYGKEDLPYIMMVHPLLYRQAEIPANSLHILPNNDPTYPAATYKAFAMLHPVLWAPHAPGATGQPTKFRVTALSNSTPSIDIEPTSDRPANGKPFFLASRDAWWVRDPSGASAATGNVKFIGVLVPGRPRWIGGENQAIGSANDILKSPDADFDNTRAKRSFHPSGDYLEFTADTEVLRQPMIIQVDGAPGITGLTSSTSNPNFPASEIKINANELIDTGVINPSVLPDAMRVHGFGTGYNLAGPFLNGSTQNLYNMQITSAANEGFQFALEYYDGSNWLIYDVMRGLKGAEETCFTNTIAMGRGGNLATARQLGSGYYYELRADARSDRFSFFNNRFSPRPEFGAGGVYKPVNQTMRDSKNPVSGMDPTRDTGPYPFDNYLLWANLAGQRTKVGHLERNIDGSPLYYKDPDGVVRPGDGALASGNDGFALHENNFPSRPVILNRPFRSVAELGYAFRDLPFKTLDFSNPKSGDSALLDVFRIGEPDTADGELPVVAAKTSLNTRHPEVIAALLRGGSRSHNASVPALPSLNETEANKLAKALVAWTTSANAATGRGPMRSVAEMIGKATGVTASPYAGFAGEIPSALSSGDPPFKERREAFARALAGSTQTRTWNLLIDLIVQTGRFASNADSMDDFLVGGQRRYWVHLAIDRHTLKILEARLEHIPH